jgi:hypothetical protein
MNEYTQLLQDILHSNVLILANQLQAKNESNPALSEKNYIGEAIEAIKDSKAMPIAQLLQGL